MALTLADLVSIDAFVPQVVLHGASQSLVLGLAGMPTVQRFLSGTGIYTPTSSAVTWIMGRMKAGGAGGQTGTVGQFASGTAGTDGTNTTFADWSASGGSAGGSGVPGGFGGTDGTGILIDRRPGDRSQIGGGWSGLGGPVGIYGRSGAGSGGGIGGAGADAGGNAIANSGGGGGGGGPGTAAGAGFFGAGGGEGEEVEFLMTAAQASGAVWTVGNGGAGGPTVGNTYYGGGYGAAGRIILLEFYTPVPPALLTSPSELLAQLAALSGMAAVASLS